MRYCIFNKDEADKLVQVVTWLVEYVLRVLYCACIKILERVSSTLNGILLQILV